MDTLFVPDDAGSAGSDAAYLAELRRAWVNEKAAPDILKCATSCSLHAPGGKPTYG